MPNVNFDSWHMLRINYKSYPKKEIPNGRALGLYLSYSDTFNTIYT